jgi:hypothetical protein
LVSGNGFSEKLVPFVVFGIESAGHCVEKGLGNSRSSKFWLSRLAKLGRSSVELRCRKGALVSYEFKKKQAQSEKKGEILFPCKEGKTELGGMPGGVPQAWRMQGDVKREET